jgi:predicted nuclease of restriction endonuclease-like (RecB) superfamily
MTNELLPESYPQLLAELKERIQNAQIKAVLGVNRELMTLYWEIGKRIVEQQEAEGWGKGTLERLGVDLQREFPGSKGFSPRNVRRMRAFYLAYPAEGSQVVDSNLPQVVAQLPWGHNILLLQKIKDKDVRLWYAQKTVENGWSRAVLDHQIDTQLYERQGKAVTNFSATLPQPQSDLARDLLKNPYNFGFVNLDEDAVERDLESALIQNLQQFILELGKGFAYVGKQYHLEVGGEDFYLDLLFYHLHLRCFVVIDLKVTEFKPEYVGKMNFYLTAVDHQLRHADDKPSIGIVLCKSQNQVIAEYSLSSTAKPIGLAEYRALPEEVKRELPAPEELQEKLGKIWDETISESLTATDSYSLDDE